MILKVFLLMQFGYQLKPVFFHDIQYLSGRQTLVFPNNACVRFPIYRPTFPVINLCLLWRVNTYVIICW